MVVRQIPLPWGLRVLFTRPLTPTEELLEILVLDAEPLVASWARDVRGTVRQEADLLRSLEVLEDGGGPVARELAGAVRRAWREFTHRPLGGQAVPPGQLRLPGLGQARTTSEPFGAG